MADARVRPVEDDGTPVLGDQRIPGVEVAVHDRLRLAASGEIAAGALESRDVVRMLGSDLRDELRDLPFEDVEPAVGGAECEELVRPVAPGVLDSLERLQRAIVGFGAANLAHEKPAFALVGAQDVGDVARVSLRERPRDGGLVVKEWEHRP